MTTEIQKRFEDAANYDGMMGKVFPGYGQLPLVILSFLRTRLGRTAHLLDAGCGTGETLIAFATHQSEWSFVGVDPAEKMLEIARNKIGAEGIANRVALSHGTVDTLFDGPRFHAATCILVEHLQPDDGAKLHLLEGIHRRMVSGGWFVLFGLHGNLATERDQNALNAWLEFVTLQGLPGAMRDNVSHRATVEDSLIPEERVEDLLREAGFVDIEMIYKLQLLGGWFAKKP